MNECDDDADAGFVREDGWVSDVWVTWGCVTDDEDGCVADDDDDGWVTDEDDDRDIGWLWDVRPTRETPKESACVERYAPTGLLMVDTDESWVSDGALGGWGNDWVVTGYVDASVFADLLSEDTNGGCDTMNDDVVDMVELEFGGCVNW